MEVNSYNRVTYRAHSSSVCFGVGCVTAFQAGPVVERVCSEVPSSGKLQIQKTITNLNPGVRSSGIGTVFH